MIQAVIKTRPIDKIPINCTIGIYDLIKVNGILKWCASEYFPHIVRNRESRYRERIHNIPLFLEKIKQRPYSSLHVNFHTSDLSSPLTLEDLLTGEGE